MIIVQSWGVRQAIEVVAALYVAMFCCFAGYRLRQAMVTLGGIVAGAVLGFVLARLLRLPVYWWGVGLAAGLGIGLGLLAFRMHKLGLFLVCGACALALTYRLLSPGLIGPLEPWVVWTVSTAVGLLAGLLVYRFYRPAVIVITALFGGMLFASTVFGLLPQDAAVQYLGQGVGLMTGAVGMVYQFRGGR